MTTDTLIKIPPGRLNNSAIETGQKQKPLHVPVAVFNNTKIVKTDEGLYTAVTSGCFKIAQTTEALHGTGKFQSAEIDANTFASIVSNTELIAKFREAQIVEAARQWAEARRIDGTSNLSFLNDCLLIVLAVKAGAGSPTFPIGNKMAYWVATP